MYEAYIQCLLSSAVHHGTYCLVECETCLRHRSGARSGQTVRMRDTFNTTRTLKTMMTQRLGNDRDWSDEDLQFTIASTGGLSSIVRVLSYCCGRFGKGCTSYVLGVWWPDLTHWAELCWIKTTEQPLPGPYSAVLNKIDSSEVWNIWLVQYLGNAPACAWMSGNPPDLIR